MNHQKSFELKNDKNEYKDAYIGSDRKNHRTIELCLQFGEQKAVVVFQAQKFLLFSFTFLLFKLLIYFVKLDETENW